MSYESVVLGDSPKAYWRLGESSGTSAADTSGNSNPGEYKGTPSLGATGALVGDSNTAVLLNGTSQYLRVPDSASLAVGDVFSYEIWIKRSSTGKAVGLMTKGSGAAKISLTSANKILFRRPGFLDLTTSTAAITDTTTWHHIVATKSGAAIKLWLDGVDVTGATTNSTCASNAEPIFIGSESATEEFFPGSIDEVAVYGTALSEARIKAHYEAGTVAAAVGPRPGSRSLLGVGR